MTRKEIAALFVASGGIYSSLAGVDPWDIERDARKYKGPHPVVTHPPCKRWCKYWYGGRSAKVRKMKGDDDGCFSHALWAVRTFGGVLEHPEASAAWPWHGLVRPPRAGGWVEADGFGGFTCCVEQGHYGHLARKATWLYAVRCDLPDLAWGPSVGPSVKLKPSEHLSKAQRAATPPEFAGILIAMARSVNQ